VLNKGRHGRKSPFDMVPEDNLLLWCEREPKSRFPAVAAVIGFSVPPSGNEARRWTSIALRLLDRAPDRIEVLKQLIKQFSPRSWTGSRVAIIEANATLLDELKEYPDSGIVKFVTQERTRLSLAVEHARRLETVMDRERDERFE
jgi:hypothetical protein